MLEILTNISCTESIVLVSLTASIIGVTFCIYNNFRNDAILRQPDPSRLQEGLPTDITLTSADFENNPDLVKVFEGEGVDPTQNVNVVLQGPEHFELLKNQLSIFSFDNLMAICDAVVAFFSSFF